MKIDRSQDSALEVVKLNSIEKTDDISQQKLAVELLKIGFENQFQKNETTRIKNLVNDVIDEYLRNKH